MVKTKKHSHSTKKPTRKHERLKNQKNFSASTLLAFILIFCAVAGYSLYKSFAAGDNYLTHQVTSNTSNANKPVQTSNLRSDINNDGKVNRKDAPLISEAFSNKDLKIDFNNDGQINLVDLEIFRSEYQK